MADREEPGRDEVFLEIFKSIYHTQQVKNDDFFPNEIIDKVSSRFFVDYSIYNRIPSMEEEAVITPDAFNLLLFWVKNGDITLDFFERFLTILVSHIEKIFDPVDEDSLTSMVEMIALVDYPDHAIYTAIEIFIDAPETLNRVTNLVL
jgi:hypothetical protein